MGSRRIITLQSPTGGVNRRLEYQFQPPFTTPSAINVRSRSTRDGRSRVARRPGKAKYSSTQLGVDGNRNIQMLALVGTAETETEKKWYEPYTSTSPRTDGWKAYTYYTDSDIAGWLTRNISSKTMRTKGSTALQFLYSQPITTEPGTAYKVSVPFVLDSVNSRIIVTIGSALPEADLLHLGSPGSSYPLTGVLCSLRRTSSHIVWDVADWNGSVSAASWGGTLPVVASGVVDVSITGTTVTVSCYGGTLASFTITAPSFANLNIGIVVGGAITTVGQVLVTYTGVSFVASRRVLAIGSGGKVYLQNTKSDTPTAITSTLDISPLGRIRAAELSGKLYIADNSTPRELTSSGATTVDDVVCTGKVLTSVKAGNWENNGSTSNDTKIKIGDIVHMTRSGVDYQGIVSVISGTSLTVTNVNSARDIINSSGTPYTIIGIFRSIKYINPASSSVAISVLTARASSTSGVSYAGNLLPYNCKLIAQQWGRIIVAGDGTTAIYASAINDATDWLYSNDGSGGASAWGGPTETRTIIGFQPTALCPYGDTSLIVSTSDSLFAYPSDPGFTGEGMRCISRIVGIISADAWCNTPDGYLVFLAKDGLYVVPPGAVFASGDSSIAQKLSDKVVPAELVGIDVNSYRVQLIYNTIKDGVDIYVTPVSETMAQHWFMDWERKGLLIDTGHSDHGPTAVGYDADGQIILGGRDGYLRQWSDTAEDDDGVEIEGSCMVGPFQCAPGGMNGAVIDIMGTLTNESDDVTWGIKTGQTPQDAIDATAAVTGTWEAGLNRKRIVERGGPAAILELTGTGRWEFEQAVVTVEQSGVLWKA